MKNLSRLGYAHFSSNSEIFQKAHDDALTLEDDRLEELDTVTKKWWTKIRQVQHDRI
jgi:hypothetical protein